MRIRSRAPGSAARLLESDMVVDATGLGSHTPVWLASLGFPRPEESTIEVGIGYTTAVFPRREGDLGNVLAVIIGPTVAVPRFGVALAIEGARWMMAIGGYRGDHAPLDGMAGYPDFAETLAAPDVADLSGTGTRQGPRSPTGSGAAPAATTNVWRASRRDCWSSVTP